MKKIFIIFVLSLISAVFSAVCADDLGTVQQSGVLRFAHTPDYAPFAYTEEDGTSNGIDIGMLQEIARRMGVRLQAVPMPRSKMFDALNSGQADVIGGALSMTDERTGEIDFTIPYYNSDSLFICLNTYYKPEQVTLYNFYQAKIGVEKGSNFEQWVNANLVKDNYVQRSDVFAYDTITEAMKALDVAAVNLVIMDREPYRTLYEPTGKYKVFYEDVQKEEYAYGLRKGSSLTAVLNKQLQDMFNDGTAQDIANRFFDMDFSRSPQEMISKPQGGQESGNPDPAIQKPAEGPGNVMPTPIMVPTAALPVIPAPSCINDMGNVVDVSDSTGPVEPGAQFRRRWQFKNTGTCTWTKDYRFELASGTNMGTNGFSFPGEVVPGGYFELYVDLLAPATPGNYSSVYQMKSPQGQLFGQPAVLNLTVGTAAAPQATQTPQEDGQSSTTPQIAEFSASSYQGYAGDAVTIYWSVSDAIGVQIFVDDTEIISTDSLNGSAAIYETLQDAGPHEILLAAQSVTGASFAAIYYETLE